MSRTVGDFVIERLGEWGVEIMFGYPGDGINGVFAALQKADCPIKFVQVRHEEMAAFMATAFAKFSSTLGVCISTGGPGATHMITGLYDARLDHQPVLAITGGAARGVRGAHYQQEINIDRAFADAALYVQEAMVPEAVPHVLDTAIRVAKAGHGVGAIVLPADLQLEHFAAPPREHGFTRSGSGYAAPRLVPYPAELQRAADLLNAGDRVAILIGAGSICAPAEVVAVADALGAGVAKALLGKQALPDDLPFVTGTIGLLGTAPSSDMMDACDTLLMVGTSFPWSEFLPKTGQARAVQIDRDAASLGLRYPTEVNLHGNSAETLRALLPLLIRKTDRAWRETIEKNVVAWWKVIDDRAHAKAIPVNPQRGVGNVAAARSRCDRHQRFGQLRQLVCARLPREGGPVMLAVGRARFDGRSGALCDRGQVRASRSAGDRAGRRRRDADEQHGRANHRSKILARVGQPGVDLLCVQQ